MTTDRLGPLRTLYPVDEVVGMPLLLPTRIPSEWPGRVTCQGWQRVDQAGGAAHTYFTDDFRFTSAWSKPEVHRAALVRSGAVAVAEPDETIQGPWPEKLHAVYRMRWVARHWQAAGLPVIPLLTWDADDPEGSVWWACAGIPAAPEMAIVEARPRYLDRPEFRAGMLAAIRHVRPRRILCYGGLPDFLPAELEVRWCRAWTPHWRSRGESGVIRK